MRGIDYLESPVSSGRPLVVKVLVLFSIARFSLSCFAVLAVEAYWTTQPIRPDCSYAVLIMWAFFELPLAVGLWFPQHLSWFVVLANDAIATFYLAQLVASGLSDCISLALGLPFLLNAARVAILLLPETRNAYWISFLR
ncbi:MAG: hypothetical protein ACXAEN_10975 [Candidatus Thorarchaeota archaeon]|jgi:hypothetical protein